MNFLTTTSYIPAYTSGNYFLGDYYLIVRNDSGINITVNTTSLGGESTYQFMGDKIYPLRYRGLKQSEIDSRCYKTLIDDYFDNELMVLDLFYNNYPANPGYFVNEFSYGNLASTIRIIPPTPADYLSFSYPTYTTVISSPTRFQWDFLNVATDTTYSHYLENE